MKLELFNEDCMDVMARYPDNYFDLAVVDPPYGIGENGSNSAGRGGIPFDGGYKTFGSGGKPAIKAYKPFAGSDISAPDKMYFLELQRVSANCIIWGANHFMQNIGLGSSCWLVWDKKNGASDFADCELAYTSFSTAVRIFDFKWQGMLQGNMKNRETRIHPTQKPVELYKWIYANYAKPDMKILDTHLGSGSNAIAAYEMNMGEFVGAELDADYFTAASARIERAMGQGKLF